MPLSRSIHPDNSGDIPPRTERRPGATNKGGPSYKGLPHVEDILNSLSDTFIALDREWRILFVNASYVNLVSELYPAADQLIGEILWEKFPDIYETEAGQRYRAAMETGKADAMEMYYAPLDRWLELRIYPSPNTLSIYARDIGESKRAARHTQFLGELSQQLALLSGPYEIIQQASESIGLHLNVDRCFFCRLNEAATEVDISADWARPGFEPVAGRHPTERFGTRDLWAAMADGKVAVNDTSTHPLVRGAGTGYRDLHVRAHASVPYFRDHRWIGCLVVACGQNREWREDEIALMENALARVWPLMEQAIGQQELRESERRQRDLMQSLPVACYTIDTKGQLTFFNEAATRLWGQTPRLGEKYWGEASAMSRLDGTPMSPDNFPVAMALREKRSIRGVEAYLIRPDGSRRWVVPNPDPIVDAHGNCIGAVDVVMDVTEERVAHEKTQKTAKQLSLAISAANLGDWNWDASTDQITLSPRSCEIYGIRSVPGLTRTQMRDMLPVEDRERAREALLTALATHTDYDIEYRVAHPGGTQRWVAVKGRAYYRQDGEIAGMVGMVQDIDDRKRQVEQLQALSRKIEVQTRLFDATLSNITDLAYVFDLQGRFTFANKPLLNLWGRTLEQIVGKNCMDLGYPVDLANRLQREIEEVISTGRPIRGETVFTDATGRTDFHEYIFNPVRAADDSITAVAGSTRIITERRLAEEALREARERLEATLIVAEIGTWLWDIPTNIVKTDRNMAFMFGLKPNEAGRQVEDFLEMVHPEDRARVGNEITAALTGGTFESDYRLLLQDGSIRWFAARGMVQHDSAGKPLRLSGVLIDITERKNQEVSLAQLTLRIEEQARVFNTALSHITDFAYIFDLNGRFVYANKPLLDLWGLTLDQMAGKNFLELNYPPALAEKLQQQINQVITSGQLLCDEVSYTSPSGQEGTYEYILNPVIGADGTVNAVAGSTRDISERKRAEIVRERHRRVLQLIVSDAPLNQILEPLMQTVELGSEVRLFSSVMLLIDDQLKTIAAPSLPAPFNAAMDRMEIGPHGGSCGTSAWSKESVYVADIANDPRWGAARETALAHGLRACWATPILSSEGDVLGTFALYYPEPREQIQMDQGFIELTVRTAAIAIENKRASAALQQSQNHLRIALETARLGSFEWDAASDEVHSSARCKANFGIPIDLNHVTDQDYANLVHPEDASRVRAVTLAAAKSSDIYEVEYRVLWPDQTLHWIVESGRGLRDEHGRVTKVVGVTHDITERKAVEETLRRSEAQLRLVTDNAPVLLIRADAAHRFTFVNRAYAERQGRTPDEMIGRSIAEVVGAAAYEILKPRLNAALGGERVEFEMEIPYERVEGRWIHAVYVPERDSTGQVSGLLGVITDIGARKRTEFELQRARDEALEASRAKDDFLAALSHELRTPLNPVLLLASDAAGNPALPANIRADFDMIRKNVNLEARLIDDLLDLTRITRGKLTLEKKRCDLHGVLKDAMANIQPDLADRKQELFTRFQADHTIVLGDAVRLQQVFWNILKNAVKFTPLRGKISVETSVSPDKNTLKVLIADTGIGMTPEEIARAFQAFVQGDHATSSTSSHRFGGLGLGLAISKTLIDLHGGKITALSEGRHFGCTFMVELPLCSNASDTLVSRAPFATDSLPTMSADSRSPHPPGEQTTKRVRSPSAFQRILLVEDHAATRMTLQHLLTLRHFEVATAASATDAIHLADSGHYDLVISDVGLPDRNGYELMNELRSRYPRLTGIALSGYGMEEDLARSQAAGFSKHLVKPVTIAMLEDAIDSLAHPHSAPTESTDES